MLRTVDVVVFYVILILTFLTSTLSLGISYLVYYEQTNKECLCLPESMVGGAEEESYGNLPNMQMALPEVENNKMLGSK